MSDLFLIIDGNSLINRAFYALPPLLTDDGRPSNAVYGFTTMLLRAISEYKPNQIAVAFDLPAPTFRHKHYPMYKATRKGMPDELAVQLPMLKQLLNDMGIKIIQKEGYEGDDLIGTLTKCKTQIIILTGDKDAFQLINSSTRVGYTKKGVSSLILYDENALKRDFGLSPNQIIDYKALAGDLSDNIPGVHGIGDKTAMSLLQQFSNLDGIYSSLEMIKGTVREKLILGKDSAYLSKFLATIDRSAPIEICNIDCGFSLPFSFKARQRLMEFNIHSIAKKEELFEKNDCTNEQINKIIAPKIVELDSFNGIKIEKDFAISLNEKLMIATDDAQYSINIAKNLLDFGITQDKILSFLLPLLLDEKIEKTVFDLKTLMRFVNSKVKNCFDSKLALYILGQKAENEQDLCSDFGLEQKDYAYALYLSNANLKEKINKSDCGELYYNVELPLTDVLFDMEKRGFKLDMEINANLNAEFNQRTAKIIKEIHLISGEEFNVNSPKQLAQILFNKLKIPYPKKSKNYSTAFEILEPLSLEYPIVSKVLDYRSLAKLNNTYVEGLKRLADPFGVVHTEFKQMLTTTGRLSSIEPNLQNIPIRDEEGKRIRTMFISREGYTLICADYSQIELRLLAHFSSDLVMCNAFKSGGDIHTQTANLIFGEVNANTRRQAKAINFGIVYGISDFGLSEQLHIPVYKAREIISEYFKKFPQIKEYLDKSVIDATECGYAKTLFGRIRPLPELKSSNVMLKKFGQRASMNMPLQGTSADIIKIAMNNVYKKLADFDAHLILQVHDELIVECIDSEVENVKKILVDCMENAVSLNVPLSVSVDVAKRWSDCK